MEEKCLMISSNLPQDPREATSYVVKILFNEIYPLIIRIRNKIQSYDGELLEDEVLKIQNVYSLCSNQIKKCMLNLFELFKTEYHHRYFLHESRQFTLERLSWCCNRLLSIEQLLVDSKQTSNEDKFDNSILVTPMYFVNWIDNTFDILTKLADIIYKNDYKEGDELFDQWKLEMVECVSGLHISLDELLLSAMTLCRYCLPKDQLIVKARCQVVLRETKALLSELIEGDLSGTINISIDTLKLPIMPSNVNVLIDVLKDVLYILETNTNTALLALLVHCFSNSKSPVDVLKDHYKSDQKNCPCHMKSDDAADDCSFVKEFDLYNERLLQIGSFAISCSSDQNRILILRSGLASLEALDPHLVPSLMLSPECEHSLMLINSWKQEVQEIGDSVFLIVDPAAFAEKSKQMMHEVLLEIITNNVYNNESVCSVINIGCVVHQFFNVYVQYEPDALPHHDKLLPLLSDLNKVQMECKIVSNVLSTGDDFKYDVKEPNKKDISVEQLIKRLKLLYTLVNRINSLMHPKETDEQLFELCEEEQQANKNVTHTIYAKNAVTYINSPRKPNNISRSMFARTNMRSSTQNFPLARLTKHLSVKQGTQLSFSVQLDELNISDINEKGDKSKTVFVNKNFERVRESSVFYNFSPINKRSSLRKAVLNKHCKLSMSKVLESKDDAEKSVAEKDQLIDEATSLQITDILNQIHDITSTLSTTNQLRNSRDYETSEIRTNKDATKNILSLNINNHKPTVFKSVWNIPVNSSTVDMALDESARTDNASNITQPSNVTTLERISDLDLLESRLSSLKSQMETSL